MRHCKRCWSHWLHVDGLHGLQSWASRQWAWAAVSLHTHCPFSPPQAELARGQYRYSSTASVPSGLHVSQDFLRQVEKSVSQLDNMVGQLNDTSSLKAEQIRDLRRRVNRLEPVSALVSQHRHIESEVLHPLSPSVYSQDYREILA